MRSVTSFLVVPAIVYLGFCAYVYATQRSMIYFPTAASPAPGAEIVPLESGGETLRIVTITRPGPRALIYFGGNAEDVALNVDSLSLAIPEYSLYLVNYRGYGGSTGRPTEAGLFSDALEVYDHVRARHPQTSVLGRSLGSGVAVYLASERPVDRLVLVTPFDSLANVARTHLPVLPAGLLLKDRYESANRAPAVTAPVLTVIAENDEIIPRARSNALVDAFRPGQVRVAVIDDVRHNTLDTAPEYLASVGAFLAERPTGPPP
jgi:pimeloyl-ACP methyl ester carboxylesterase